MAENEQDIILRVKADTGDAQDSVQGLKDKLDEVNDTPLDKPFKSFRTEIREAIGTAKQMQEQFGHNSQQFVDAAKNVAQLKKNYKDFGETVQAFNPENKLQALVQVARGATGTLQGVSGAMAFLGVESGKATETLAKLQGLMAFSAALNSVDEIKKGFIAFKLVVSDAFNSLKESIGSTGIGLLVIAIGAAVTAFIQWKDATDKANVGVKALEDTTKDYTKAAADASAKVNQVKAGFDLATKGVLTKKEALQKYNDTLGETLGKAKSLKEAEDLVAKDADKYIQIQGLKAQANALFAKSAEESANAVLAQDQLNKSKLSKDSYLVKALQDKIKDQISQGEVINKLAEGLEEKAAGIAKTGKHITANILDNKTDDKKDKKDNSKKLEKEKEEVIKAQKELQAIIDKGYQEAEKARATAQQKELLDAKDHALEMEAKVKEISEGEIKVLKEELKDKSITKAEYDKQITALTQKSADANIAIETEHLNQVQAINKKYYDEAIKAEKELAAKKEEAHLKETEKQTTELIANIKKEVDDKSVSFENKKKLIDDEREYVLSSTQYTADERTKILNELADAEKKIDDEKLAAKKNNIDLETGLLVAASELAGKNTVAGKALAIASATISTYEAAQGAYKSQMSIPSPDAPLRAAAAAALAILQGLARVKAIVAVKVPTKSGGSGTGGAAAPNVSAPQINATLLQPQQNQIVDVRVTNPQNQAVRAYIVQNDLQANQDRTAFLNNLGRIG